MKKSLLLLAALAAALTAPAGTQANRSLSNAEIKQLQKSVAGFQAKRTPLPDQVKQLIQQSYTLRQPGFLDRINVFAFTEKSGQPAPSAAITIRRLEDAGFIHDTQYATNFIEMVNLGRIYAGKPAGAAPDTQHPDCVAVGAGPDPQDFRCTGTLVAPQVVITAGHCAGKCDRYVLFGDSIDSPAKKIVKVRRSIRHDGYTATDTTLTNDLTVLILDTPVTDVSPRRIARTEEIAAAHDAYIAGYGTTDAQGLRGYGRRLSDGPAIFADPANPIFGADAATELVLGKQPDGLDSCAGDSGGPIYLRLASGDAVAGATSRGVRNATPGIACGEGGIYVRLDKYLPWIISVATEAGVTLPSDQ